MSCKRLDGLDSRAGLDVVERSSLAGNKTPVVHPVTYHCNAPVTKKVFIAHYQDFLLHFVP